MRQCHQNQKLWAVGGREAELQPAKLDISQILGAMRMQYTICCDI